MHLGVGEMLVVLVIALLIFGPSKLPQLGDALGKGIRAFKKATTEDDPIETAQRAPERPQLASPASTAAPSAEVKAAQPAQTSGSGR